MSTNILILGLGSLGLPVTTHLATHPARPPNTTTLTVTTSRPLPTPLSALDIKSLPLDITTSSTAELAKVFRDYDTIISCTGMSLPPGSQRKIAEAVILAANDSDSSGSGKPKPKKRYIPWQFGVDYDAIGRGSVMPLFDEQVDVRDLLRGQEGLEWVVVSTGVFVGFLFRGAWNVVEEVEEEQGGQRGYVVRALGEWSNRVTVTDEEGIGRCVAEVVWGSGVWEEVRNGVVKVAGDCVEYGRVADVVGRVTGKEVRREVWRREDLRDEVQRDPGNVLKRYRAVFAEGRGVAWPVDSTFNHKKGLNLMGVEDWARQNFKQ